MLTYADVCWGMKGMLEAAVVESSPTRMLTHADVCWGMKGMLEAAVVESYVDVC